MSSLSQVVTQIKSEIVVDSEGKGKASIRATARLAGVEHSSLLKAFNTGVLEPSKLAGKLISQGFESGVLITWIDSGVPDLAVAVICEYYAFDAGRYCNEQAKLVYRAFASIGVRAWMQDVTGYQKPTISTPQTYIEALKALVASEESRLALEKEKEILEIQNGLLEDENLQLSETVDELFDYSSIIRIAKYNNVSETNFKWQRLKAFSISMKLEIKKVPCPRYVTKNLYSHDAWRMAYPDFKLPETLTLVVKK